MPKKSSASISINDIPSIALDVIDYNRILDNDILQSDYKMEHFEYNGTQETEGRTEKETILENHHHHQQQMLDENCNEIIEILPTNTRYDLSVEANAWNVMAKLLNMWRYEGYDKINANEFCKNSGNRFKKASTFGALMGILHKLTELILYI